MCCYQTDHVELQMSLRCNNPHLLQLTSLQHVRQLQLKNTEDQAVVAGLKDSQIAENKVEGLSKSSDQDGCRHWEQQ